MYIVEMTPWLDLQGHSPMANAASQVILPADERWIADAGVQASMQPSLQHEASQAQATAPADSSDDLQPPMAFSTPAASARGQPTLPADSRTSAALQTALQDTSAQAAQTTQRDGAVPPAMPNGQDIGAQTSQLVSSQRQAVQQEASAPVAWQVRDSHSAQTAVQPPNRAQDMHADILPAVQATRTVDASEQAQQQMRRHAPSAVQATSAADNSPAQVQALGYEASSAQIGSQQEASAQTRPAQPQMQQSQAVFRREAADDVHVQTQKQVLRTLPAGIQVGSHVQSAHAQTAEQEQLHFQTAMQWTGSAIDSSAQVQAQAAHLQQAAVHIPVRPASSSAQTQANMPVGIDASDERRDSLFQPRNSQSTPVRLAVQSVHAEQRQQYRLLPQTADQPGFSLHESSVQTYQGSQHWPAAAVQAGTYLHEAPGQAVHQQQYTEHALPEPSAMSSRPAQALPQVQCMPISSSLGSSTEVQHMNTPPAVCCTSIPSSSSREPNALCNGIQQLQAGSVQSARAPHARWLSHKGACRCGWCTAPAPRSTTALGRAMLQHRWAHSLFPSRRGPRRKPLPHSGHL